MSNEVTLNEIRRMLLVNFFEMQEIKRKLNIQMTTDQDLYDYQNAASEYLEEHGKKMRNIVKNFPQFWDGTSS